MFSGSLGSMNPDSPAIKRRWVEAAADLHTDECVDWPWGVDGDGYPTYRPAGGRTLRLTHVVLDFSGRPRPASPGNHALHSCDRPVCLNPAHLRWGTLQDNNRDQLERGQRRQAAQHGERNGRAKLSSTQVLAIRARVAAGEGQRALAREHGVHHSVVQQIVRGTAWRQLST